MFMGVLNVHMSKYHMYPMPEEVKKEYLVP